MEIRGASESSRPRQTEEAVLRLHPNRTHDLKNQKPTESPKVSQKEKDKYRILTHIYGI